MCTQRRAHNGMHTVTAKREAFKWNKSDIKLSINRCVYAFKMRSLASWWGISAGELLAWKFSFSERRITARKASSISVNRLYASTLRLQRDCFGWKSRAPVDSSKWFHSLVTFPFSAMDDLLSFLRKTTRLDSNSQQRHQTLKSPLKPSFNWNGSQL